MNAAIETAAYDQDGYTVIPIADQDFALGCDGALWVPGGGTTAYHRSSGENEVAHPVLMQGASELDRDRVLHSPFLRRLGGVAQVVSPDPDLPNLHSRLTHSQKVAQVSRQLANSIVRLALRDGAFPKIEDQEAKVGATRAILEHGGIDPVACETAGLAHDFGHPPFGHVGEKVLDRELRRRGVSDGFEGNAQTFRILTRLDQRKAKAEVGGSGLDLTSRTLCAILKYPWTRETEPKAPGKATKGKFNAYLDDADEFVRVRSNRTPTAEHMQTLEANVMDLADDIAYAIHDLEDFWRARVIDYRAVKQDVELFEDDVPKLISILGERDGSDGNPPDPERAEKLDILTNNPFIREAVMLLANDEFKLERWIGAVRGVGPFIDDLLRSAYDDAPSQLGALRSLMEREAVQMRENVVYRSVASPPDGAIPGFGYVAISLEHLKWHWMQVLKCISRNYVVRSAKVGLIGHSQAAAIRGLFGNLCAWFGERPGVRELPEPLRSYLLCAEIQGKVPVVNQVDVPHDVGSDEARALRAIADYICSLTDHECAARSRWLSGSEVPGLSRI